MKLLKDLVGKPSPERMHQALVFLRVGIGLLTIPHGYPKLIGDWEQLGITFMYPLGITFLPAMWGFLGAVIEFFGGIALVLGLGTRIASSFLAAMMVVATAWHIVKGDSFMAYSFPLSLLVVFIVLAMIGSVGYSFDNYFASRKVRRTRRKKA
jgi:putative oxidoreductase